MVRFCYGVIVRTTMDISDEAYYMAKTVAHKQKRSLGSIVSELIIGEKRRESLAMTPLARNSASPRSAVFAA